MPESTAIQNTERPATNDSLTADLRELGVAEGSLLLVHCSLSALGWVSGGAVAVVEALLKAVGPSGTLVMPTHSTQLSEPANWENPPVPESWWPIIRETMPPYDPRTTPTRCMGSAPEYFRTLPDSIRGDHPQFSFTARGPLAEEIVHPHPLEGGLGEASPLGRIYANDGMVLLLGVDHDNNTSIHLAEQRVFADRPGRVKNGSPLVVDGQRQWVEFEDIDVPDSDLRELGKAFLASGNTITSGKVACADSQLMSQRALVDFAQGWLLGQ